MKKISNFILSKDSLIFTLFLVQFNLCVMYSQSYFGINHATGQSDFDFWKITIISIVVCFAFANVSINVITRSKNKSDGYIFALFDFLVYCSHYGNKCVEWCNNGNYGNILQVLLFAVITSTAILKLTELFLAEVHSTSQSQADIKELSLSNENLTNQIKELASKLKNQSDTLLISNESIEKLNLNNKELNNKLSELNLKSANLENELQNKVLELVGAEEKLAQYEKRSKIEGLQRTLQGLESQRTNKVNKNLDTSALDAKIKELNLKIQNENNL